MSDKWTYIGVLFASMFVAASAFAIDGASVNQANAQPKTTVYGLSQAAHYNLRSHGPFYVQAATFRMAKNAKRYPRKLIPKFHQHAIIKKSGNYYAVIAGPIATVAEVRALGNGRVLNHHEQMLIGDNDGVLIDLGQGPDSFEVILI